MNYKGKHSHESFIAGGLSGLASLISIYPTEYVKSQVQFHGNKQTLRDICQTTYQRWGLIGFYRGMMPLLIGSVPRSTFKFAGYEQTHYWLRRNNYLQGSPDLRNFVSGGVAGIFTAVGVSSFTDNIKMRTIYDQTQKNVRNNMLQSAQKIYQDKGIRGFYRGLSSTCIKESLTFGLRFTFYHRIFTPMHHVEAVIKGKPADKLEKNPVTSAIAGGIGGGMVCMINNPFDVTQTRMQTNYQRKYRNLPHCMLTVYREEGVKALWKGASYRSLRAVPGVMISFYVYEMIHKVFDYFHE